MFRLRKFQFRDEVSGVVREFRFARDSRAGVNGHWVTILIGKNGVGKSRILSAISSVFDSLGQRRMPRRFKLAQAGLVAWQKGRREFEAQWPGDESGPPPLEILPTRVIALATTPFDKFPRFRDDAGFVYRYLGLRNPRGMVSSGAAVFRALDRLFDAAAAGQSKRSKTADIFRMLGYEANVRIEYRVSIQADQALRSGDATSYLLHRQRSVTSRLSQALSDGSVDLMDILPTLEFVHARTNGSRFELKADFSGDSDDPQLFRDVQFLRRFDLVTLVAVSITPLGGMRSIDLMEASSGELALVTTFLGLASVIEDDSLVIIDEPEVSLHPEWQTRYIDLLMRTFSGYNGCHFIIATHSPLILSEIDPNMSEVISMERSDLAPESMLAGKSSDFLLAKAFDVAGNDNLYVKQRLVEALRIATDGKSESTDFRVRMEELGQMTRSMASNEPMKRVLDDLRETVALKNEPGE